jgi:hypothetical protein
MNGDAPISWLMFFTLAAGLIVAAGLFLYFPKSRHNRAIAATALGGDQHPRGIDRDGAGAELGGLLTVALIAMALLTFGYHSHAGLAGPNNQLATDRTNPDSPKPYQPQNPGADTRSATTGSSTGSGPDSGGHPEAVPKQ